jgi:hypothetical protein
MQLRRNASVLGYCNTKMSATIKRKRIKSVESGMAQYLVAPQKVVL